MPRNDVRDLIEEAVEARELAKGLAQSEAAHDLRRYANYLERQAALLQRAIPYHHVRVH